MHSWIQVSSKEYNDVKQHSFMNAFVSTSLTFYAIMPLPFPFKTDVTQTLLNYNIMNTDAYYRVKDSWIDF